MFTLTRSLRARELGYNTPDPSLAPFFRTLRTRPSDEYGFWNVNNFGDAVNIPPFTARFSTKAHGGHALLVGDEDGILTILDTRRSLRDQMRNAHPTDAPLSRFRAHDNAIFDAAWIADDLRVASASGDSTVRVFDPETHIRTSLCRGAAQSIKSVRMLDRGCSDSVLVSSCRDGAIRLHDLRTPAIYNPALCPQAFHKPVLEILHAHVPTPVTAINTSSPPTKRRRVMPINPATVMLSAASVTAVVTVPNRPFSLFSAGASDGSVKLWDVRIGSSRALKTLGASRRGFQPKVDSQCVERITPSDEPRGDCAFARRRRRHGIASLDVDATGTKLLASSTDSSIYLYDTNQLGLGHSQVLTGHIATSFYVRAAFSPCGRFVASGSADSKGYIWDCHELKARSHDGTRPIVQLDGHRGGDVSVVEWCKTDSLKVATCSDDTTVKIWHANTPATNSTACDRRERDERIPSDEDVAKDEGFGVAHVVDLEDDTDDDVEGQDDDDDDGGDAEEGVRRVGDSVYNSNNSFNNRTGGGGSVNRNERPWGSSIRRIGRKRSRDTRSSV